MKIYIFYFPLSKSKNLTKAKSSSIPNENYSSNAPKLYGGTLLLTSTASLLVLTCSTLSVKQ